MRNENPKNEGAVCSGAGRNDDFIFEVLAARLDERHLVVPADLVGDANAFVELDEISTDAKQDVLAVVDYFTGSGMLVRRGAAAEERALLEERHVKTVVG